MAGPAYAAPASLDEAIALLRAHGEAATVLAGSTSLTLLLRQGLIAPAVLVDIAGIPGLAGVREAGEVLEIGALTTLRAIETDPVVRARIPALAEAVGRVATIRVRNQATIGGNLAHADPAQDPPVILLALDATLALAGPDGAREVPLDGFFLDVFETGLREAELITAIRIPVPAPGSRVGYRKFLPRTADDYATVSVAARLDLAVDGTVSAARIALGAAGPVPLRARDAEARLVGGRPDASAIAEAAGLVRVAVDPLDDLRASAAYRREMAGVWTERLLTDLVTPPGSAGMGYLL